MFDLTDGTFQGSLLNINMPESEIKRFYASLPEGGIGAVHDDDRAIQQYKRVNPEVIYR